MRLFLLRVFTRLLLGAFCISFCFTSASQSVAPTKAPGAVAPQNMQPNVSVDWDDSELGSKEQMSAVVEKLKKQSGTNPNSTLNFTQGVLSFHQGKREDAILQFQAALKADNFLLDEYAHYFLGLTYAGLGKLSDASKEFAAIVNSKTAGPRKLSAQFRLGEVALAQKNYKMAELQMRGLERKVRNSDKYPFVLWNLAKISLLQKNIFQTCKYVRKLYSRYPAHPLIAQWDLSLKNAEIDGMKPGCLASTKEQKQRIKSFQYAGENERAKKEIQMLYQKANAFTKYDIDLIYARFLVDEGDVDDAFKVLLPYYEEKSGDIAYLMLIAKAASIRGDTSVAIGAYLKAHQMKPKSSVGKEALFQAAFASYLSQDYDGALQRFGDYKKLYGGKNGQISEWYVAWIRYLKGDFKGAYDMMDHFGRMRVSRKVRQQVFDPQKISYWKSVCLLKMGQIDLAKKQLDKMAQDPSMGYYTIAAKARLLTMGPMLKERKMSSIEEKRSKPLSNTPLPTTLSAESIISATLPQAQLVASDTVESDEEILADSKADTDSVSDESDETAENEAEEKTPEETTAEVAPESAPEETGAQDLFSGLKDPRLQAIFQRAEILRQIGFEDWSNKELQYIEARTRNKTYLQSLIDKYEVGNVYSRSAYIAEVYYENDRRKNFSANNPGWKKAYPEAFEKLVGKYADNYSVPQSLLWGIMRTESFFKPYAHSGVGALGLMQVMPLTGQKMADQLNMTGFKPGQLFEPDVNVKIGGKYVQRLSKMFDGYVPLVAAGYNAGPHRVYSWLKNFGKLSMDEFIEHIPYNQTRGYAKKVLRGYYVYSSLYFPDELKKNSIQWLAEPPKITYSGPVPTKETWEPF